MAKSEDKEGLGNNMDPDKPYTVGNKKPPLHTRFKSGQSGNPSGRPNSHSNLEATVMKEFYKTISATINGKPIKVTNDKLFAASLVKDGITKGPQSKLLLANIIERAEAKLAAGAEAEARKKAAAQDESEAFEWTEEDEKKYQEVMKVAGRGNAP